jgi:hypothetical protein
VIDGSRRSTKANALFTGFGRHKRVALFDTLVASLAPAEVVAVVAHEIGHYKRRHVVQGMAIAVVHMGAILFLLQRALDEGGLFAAFFVEQPSVHAGLVFFALLAAPVELVLGMLLQTLSRRNERAADAFAAATTGSGEPLARGLEKLSADSLSNPTPHPFYVALHYSHPPRAPARVADGRLTNLARAARPKRSSGEWDRRGSAATGESEPLATTVPAGARTRDARCSGRARRRRSGGRQVEAGERRPGEHRRDVEIGHAERAAEQILAARERGVDDPQRLLEADGRVVRLLRVALLGAGTSG